MQHRGVQFSCNYLRRIVVDLIKEDEHNCAGDREGFVFGAHWHGQEPFFFNFSYFSYAPWHNKAGHGMSSTHYFRLQAALDRAVVSSVATAGLLLSVLL